MPVTVKNKSGVITALIKGDIDHHSAPAIREAVDDAVISSDCVKMLVLDFSGVTFMDSSGVGMLIGRCKQMHYRTGTSKAIHVNDRVRKIFRLSGLEHMIAIEEEEEDHG